MKGSTFGKTVLFIALVALFLVLGCTQGAPSEGSADGNRAAQASGDAEAGLANDAPEGVLYGTTVGANSAVSGAIPADDADVGSAESERGGADGTGTTAGAAPEPVSVSLFGFAFDPAEITVPAGTEVTWTNFDSATHTVTSDAGIELDSGDLGDGDAYVHTFLTPGTFAYHCTHHPGMRAKITVE